MYVILVVNTVIAQVPPATTRTYAKQAEKKEFKRRSMRQQTVLFFPSMKTQLDRNQHCKVGPPTSYSWESLRLSLALRSSVCSASSEIGIGG